MALSNIGKEPRREITESAVGISVTLLVLGGLGWGDYKAALWFQSVSGCPWGIGMVLIVVLVSVVLALYIPFLHITHEIGDAICDGLDALGIHLRPRNRPGRR